MTNKVLVLLACLFWLNTTVYAQEKDSVQLADLKAVTITGYKFPQQELKHLDDVQPAYIASGKKNEVIQVADLPANIAEKNGRQIFAKIPGAFVYDMDGSGNQVNIATRGLDPHRSWEYNVRQNGVQTNSDMYGYPASHYSPPMEAIQRIELVRGTASLQYGAQFGGMINYITKQADTTRRFSFENISSAGSFGLLSVFNAVGGKMGNLTYYAYQHNRVSQGYRDNARSNAQAQFVSLKYAPSAVFSVKAELGRSQYLYQLPGPLTDAMFQQSPRQSTRSRNYYSPDIYVPSLTVNWTLGPSTRLQWLGSAVLGTRSSVQLIGLADVVDTIEAATLQYRPRQVDIDAFNSYGSELTLAHDYKTGQWNNTLVAGIRYANNDLHRRQQGRGTTGTDYDLAITEPLFGRDVHFKTQNVALFVENLFRVTPRLHVSPGARLESGVSKLRGIVAYLPMDEVPDDIEHRFLLLGVSAQYALSSNVKIYGGWSQAYRPVILSDALPPTFLDRTDPQLKDAFGYNAELGIKGCLLDRFTFDFNFFQILYQNRIGTLVEQADNGQTFFLKTNIGDSRTNGLEMYVDVRLVQRPYALVSVFSATSFMDAVYKKGTVRHGNSNVDVAGNRLETVPRWISRNGLQVAYKQFSAIAQFSYVGDLFSDALNTATPTVNGAQGLVPGYALWDLNASFRIKPNLVLRAGINNLTNRQYFTKRPTGYPGPGVWPSDGRSFFATVALRL